MASTNEHDPGSNGATVERSLRQRRHDLNNALGALVLRINAVQSDPRCKSAQGKNLEAVERLVKKVVELAAQLETDGGSG